MDVSTLLTNIKSVSLIGNTDAVSDTAKLLAYLNMSYRAEYDRVTREFPSYVQTTQTVTITSGAGTFIPQPHLILSVFDTSHNVWLKPTDVLHEEQLDPALASVGVNSVFWLEGFTGIRTYPLGNASLRVRYVPQEGELTSMSVSADIKFPPNFHDLLMWCTALTIAYDERDKVVGAELKYTEDKANEERERLSSYLRMRVPRVKSKVEMPGFHAY